MERFYDIDIAKKYGIAAAVIYRHIKEIDENNEDLDNEIEPYMNIQSVVAEFREFEAADVLRAIASLLEDDLLVTNGTMNLYSRWG